MSESLRAWADIKAALIQLSEAVDRAMPVEATTVTEYLKPGHDLQSAVDRLLPTGGLIQLAPGLYQTNLILRERPANAPLIVIRADPATLPPAGTQIPRDAYDNQRLPLLRAANTSTPVVWAEHRANGYDFLGIAHGPQMIDRTLVELGGDRLSLTRPEDRPYDIQFDRCLWMGDPEKGQHRGLQPHGKDITVTCSGFYDFYERYRDAQAICGWNGTENLLVENCYLEGAGENFIIGGGDSASPEMAPRNVRFERVHCCKPLRWRELPSWREINIKAIAEVKHCRGFVLRNSLVENNWSDDWPSGVGITIKVANGDGKSGREPWAQTDDVLIEAVVVRNCGSAFSLVGEKDGTNGLPTQHGARWTIRHVLAYNLNTDPFFGDGRAFMVTNPPHDLTIDHVTILGNSHSLLDVTFGGGVTQKATGFRLTNSVAYHGTYGVRSQQNPGLAGLLPYFDAPTLVGNTLRRHPARTVPLPLTNRVLDEASFDASLDQDHQVQVGSAIANAVQTTDGTLSGADVLLLREFKTP